MAPQVRGVVRGERRGLCDLGVVLAVAEVAGVRPVGRGKAAGGRMEAGAKGGPGKKTRKILRKLLQ